MRTPQIGRLYLQVPADDDISQWPDDRIWDELSLRLAVPGWHLRTGPVLDKSITGMRSFVAAPMRYRRLFLAGDAAHIVPLTGAKGLNLAVADVAALATALIGLLRYGRTDLADAYSDTCQERAWRATYLSWWMTTMLHVLPRQDPFDSAIQIAQLRNLTSSRAAGAMLAEIYTEGAPVRFDQSPKASPRPSWGSGGGCQSGMTPADEMGGTAGRPSGSIPQTAVDVLRDKLITEGVWRGSAFAPASGNTDPARSAV